MITIKDRTTNKSLIRRGESLLFDKQNSILAYFELQAQKTPRAIAVSYKNLSLTYEELDKRINQLANVLGKYSLPPKCKVALYLKPNLSLYVALLAVLKVGGCYTPLDVNYPKNRINFMLDDSEAHLLITDSQQSALNYHVPCVMQLDLLSELIENQSITFEDKANGDNLAYIIYTSGSTGVPKGVQITHRAVNNHMLWMKQQFKFEISDKILLKTPLSFDPSVWEMLLPFHIGCELVIAPIGSHMDPEALVDLVINHKITIIQLVPTILKQLLLSKKIKDCHSLRYVFVGGESLRPEIKKLFFEKLTCSLVNLYGPTEATIDITYHKVAKSNMDINTNIIGRPVTNTSLYVLNKDLKLTSPGTEGELYIGSESLAEGYHRRDALTTEHFLDNPFEPLRFKKMYKTGDLVRWLPNGAMEFLGRNNDQVKINGVRIEPKEIVISILQHKNVSDCIVIKKMDTHGHDYLACYLTHISQGTLNISAIKNHLKKQFPAFMRPRIYIQIKKIPLTNNGKVDVHSLPEPDFTSNLIIDTKKDPDNTTHELMLIWQFVLESNQIGLQDDFFDAGGGSLLALKLIALIQEKFHITVRIKDIFEFPTLKEQVHLIQQTKNPLISGIKNNTEIPNPMICLQHMGKKNPLFLIHPVGGTVFWFSHLAKCLGTSRPIYGIQDPSIDLEKPVLNSIEEMAEFYLTHIRAIQSKGPYLIGGASFGATVAIEIARRLKESKKQVSSIIVLDGWGVYPNTLLDDNYFKNSMLRQHAELLSDFERYGLPTPEILFDIQWFRLKLLWSYHLGLIEHPIALFKSIDLLPAFSEINAPFNHWDEFSNKPITVHQVPGNHETMFQEPHVQILSEMLNNYLEKNDL